MSIGDKPAAYPHGIYYDTVPSSDPSPDFDTIDTSDFYTHDVRILQVPGFRLASRIIISLSEVLGYWNAYYVHKSTSFEGYGEGESPKEAIYDLFRVMAQYRAEYLANPNNPEFGPLERKAGKFLREMFEPVA